MTPNQLVYIATPTLVICSLALFHIYDILTWFLEVLPIFVIMPILYVYKVNLNYTLAVLIICHAFVLVWGGIHTYEREPLFDWLRQKFGFKRNNYDRLGHFLQGFTPTLVLLTANIIPPCLLGYVVSFAISQTFSSLYEIFEMVAARTMGDNSFIGSQGDIWDTQNDMLMCAIGSVCAIACVFMQHR